MRKVIDFMLFGIMLIIASCNRQDQLAPVAYVSYVESDDNQLKKKVVIGDFEYTVQLATPAYIACKELIDERGMIEPKQLTARLEELKGYSFLLVRMGHLRKDSTRRRDIVTSQDVNGQLTYYLEQASRDLTLKVGSARLKPVTYNFENNYNLTPYNTIVAGFETGNEPETLELEFNDRYRNNALIKAAFSKEDILSIPSLQLKNL